MTRKLLLFVLFLFIGIGAFEADAQSFIIKASDGTKTTKNLADLQKFTFGDSKLFLKHLNGTIDTVAVSYSTKIYFKTAYSSSPTITAIAAVDASEAISLYPNPVVDELSVKNAPYSLSPIQIFRIDGAMVMQTNVSADQPSFSVSSLAKGLYFLKINNQSFKFIKL